jgi:hypothetical protein
MRKSFAAPLAALLATACTVGPNYHPPETAVPPVFAGPQAAPAPGATIDPAHWWSAFGDPVLDGLVTRALKDNPDITIAASRVRQARLQEIAAGAVGKPTVNASGNVSHVEFSKNAGFASLAKLFSGGGAGSSGSTGGVALPGSGITTYALGFDASWELDLFGGGRRGVEAASARTTAATWSQRDAAVTLAAEVAQDYFALRLDQDQLAIGEQELTRQRRTQEITAHIAQVGLSPQVDVARERGTLTALEARLEPVRADAQVRLHALGILLGAQPESLIDELQRPLPTLGVTPGWPSCSPRRSAISSRPTASRRVGAPRSASRCSIGGGARRPSECARKIASRLMRITSRPCSVRCAMSRMRWCGSIASVRAMRRCAARSTMPRALPGASMRNTGLAWSRRTLCSPWKTRRSWHANSSPPATRNCGRTRHRCSRRSAVAGLRKADRRCRRTEASARRADRPESGKQKACEKTSRLIIPFRRVPDRDNGRVPNRDRQYNQTRPSHALIAREAMHEMVDRYRPDPPLTRSKFD